MTPLRGATRVGLLEVGTNSTKLLIVDVLRSGTRRQRHFSTCVTRIGRGLTVSGRISQAGLGATLAAVRDFKSIADRHGRVRLFAFATFALRGASNGPAAARRIARESGAPLRILSGKEEAHFAYLGARAVLHLARPSTLLIDIGGGSTEMVLARGGSVQHALSLPLGALHLTERFISSDPIDRRQFAWLEAHVAETIGRALRRARIGRIAPARLDLVASGGSISTTARVIAAGGQSRARGGVLRLGDITAFLERCLALSLARRKRIRGLEPERADIIPAGVAVARAVMRHTRKRVLIPNEGGVRAGVLAHLMQNDFEW